MSDVETIEMEVHQLLKGDVDTGLVCLSGADLDELVEANRALELENRALRLHKDLLMNVVHRVYRWSDHVYDEGNAEDWYEIAMIRVQELQRSLKDLTESGFPWAAEHGLLLPGAGEGV